MLESPSYQCPPFHAPTESSSHTRPVYGYVGRGLLGEWERVPRPQPLAAGTQYGLVGMMGARVPSEWTLGHAYARGKSSVLGGGTTGTLAKRRRQTELVLVCMMHAFV
jgi:hypothetical protein